MKKIEIINIITVKNGFVDNIESFELPFIDLNEREIVNNKAIELFKSKCIEFGYRDYITDFINILEDGYFSIKVGESVNIIRSYID